MHTIVAFKIVNMYLIIKLVILRWLASGIDILTYIDKLINEYSIY